MMRFFFFACLVAFVVAFVVGHAGGRRVGRRASRRAEMRAQVREQTLAHMQAAMTTRLEELGVEPYPRNRSRDTLSFQQQSELHELLFDGSDKNKTDAELWDDIDEMTKSFDEYSQYKTHPSMSRFIATSTSLRASRQGSLLGSKAKAMALSQLNVHLLRMASENRMGIGMKGPAMIALKMAKKAWKVVVKKIKDGLKKFMENIVKKQAKMILQKKMKALMKKELREKLKQKLKDEMKKQIKMRLKGYVEGKVLGKIEDIKQQYEDAKAALADATTAVKEELAVAKEDSIVALANLREEMNEKIEECKEIEVVEGEEPEEEVKEAEEPEEEVKEAEEPQLGSQEARPTSDMSGRSRIGGSGHGYTQAHGGHGFGNNGGYGGWQGGHGFGNNGGYGGRQGGHGFGNNGGYSGGWHGGSMHAFIERGHVAIGSGFDDVDRPLQNSDLYPIYAVMIDVYQMVLHNAAVRAGSKIYKARKGRHYNNYVVKKARKIFAARKQQMEGGKMLENAEKARRSSWKKSWQKLDLDKMDTTLLQMQNNRRMLLTSGTKSKKFLKKAFKKVGKVMSKAVNKVAKVVKKVAKAVKKGVTKAFKFVMKFTPLGKIWGAIAKSGFGKWLIKNVKKLAKRIAKFAIKYIPGVAAMHALVTCKSKDVVKCLKKAFVANFEALANLCTAGTYDKIKNCYKAKNPDGTKKKKSDCWKKAMTRLAKIVLAAASFIPGVGPLFDQAMLAVEMAKLIKQQIKFRKEMKRKKREAKEKYEREKKKLDKEDAAADAQFKRENEEMEAQIAKQVEAAPFDPEQAHEHAAERIKGVEHDSEKYRERVADDIDADVEHDEHVFENQYSPQDARPTSEMSGRNLIGGSGHGYTQAHGGHGFGGGHSNAQAHGGHGFGGGHGYAQAHGGYGFGGGHGYTQAHGGHGFGGGHGYMFENQYSMLESTSTTRTTTPELSKEDQEMKNAMNINPEHCICKEPDKLKTNGEYSQVKKGKYERCGQFKACAASKAVPCNQVCQYPDFPKFILATPFRCFNGIQEVHSAKSKNQEDCSNMCTGRRDCFGGDYNTKTKQCVLWKGFKDEKKLLKECPEEQVALMKTTEQKFTEAEAIKVINEEKEQEGLSSTKKTMQEAMKREDKENSADAKEDADLAVELMKDERNEFLAAAELRAASYECPPFLHVCMLGRTPKIEADVKKMEAQVDIELGKLKQKEKEAMDKIRAEAHQLAESMTKAKGKAYRKCLEEKKVERGQEGEGSDDEGADNA